MIRKLYFILLFLTYFSFVDAQTNDNYFNESATLYFKSDLDNALKYVEKGIQQYPENQKLKRLREEILNEIENQNQKNQQQQNQDQNKQNQDNNQDQKDQNQQNQDEQNQQNEGEKKPQNQNKNDNGNTPREQRTGKGGDGQKEAEQDYSDAYAESVLNAIKEQEKRTQRNLIKKKGRRSYSSKEKDW